ncbi:MAG: hypothetical protein V4773_04515 [Verrucomicrobiota bacterium]
MKRVVCLFSLVVLLAVALGCGPKHDHHAHGAHGHTHDAKHGGVAVELGQEEFHIEFTYGDKPGVLQAYILDAHIENYVRVDAPSFTAIAVTGGASHPLLFTATASAATGEKAGDSSLFEAPLPAAIAGRPALQLSVPALSIKGRTYSNITAKLAAR